MTVMYQYAGHYIDPPRDNFGRAIPNASFQLYAPGTKTAPSFYTDRTKGTTVPGDPHSNALGNVDVYTDPGIYEYWFNGVFIDTVTVWPDGEESAYDLAQQVSILNTTLTTNYYTKAEVDTNIANNGAPNVGTELLSHKNINSGYAGLNSSGIVADAQLPTNLERTGNKNANSGYAGLDSGGKVALAQLPVASIQGTHVVLQSSATRTAAPGDFIVCDTTANAITITIPTGAGDAAPIHVKLQAGSNPVTITGTIDGASVSITLSIVGAVYKFVSGTATWYYAGAYWPLSVLARLDQDNNFAGHVLTNYADKTVNVTGATYIAGTDGWAVTLRWTNAGGTLTLPNNAVAGDWVILRQESGTQVIIAQASGATFADPDGYTKSAKNAAAVLCFCVVGGSSSIWRIGGYTGP